MHEPEGWRRRLHQSMHAHVLRHCTETHKKLLVHVGVLHSDDFLENHLGYLLFDDGNIIKLKTASDRCSWLGITIEVEE